MVFQSKIFLSLIFFLSFLAVNAGAALHVVIDPGHGGTDQGAVYGKARESEISLSVARELKTLLEGNRHFRASLTRNRDQNLTLPERAQLTESLKADVFLSIHTNASRDSRARGAEFYFQNQLPPDEESLFLANIENQAIRDSIADQRKDHSGDLTKKGDLLAIVEDLKRSHKMVQSHWLSQRLLQVWTASTTVGHKEGSAIRQAPFYVISKTTIPSVLIELGFISNPRESERLIRPSYQKEIAQRIYQGLLSYKEMVDKADLTRLQ